MEPLRIYRCNEWGAQPVNRTFPTYGVEGVVIHHTASPNRLPLIGVLERQWGFRLARTIQRDHLGRGWADSGHHLLLTRGGLALEGRRGTAASLLKGLVPVGAHAGDVEVNKRWVGIEVEGRFDAKDAVTAQQWAALVDLCAWVCHWANVDSQRIEPHSKFRATACPGKLRDRLPDLRQRVHHEKLAIQRFYEAR